MAIWQFKVALQPNKIGGDHPAAARRSSESGQAGLFQRDDADVLRAVDEILPRRESWAEYLVLCGEESGNRVHAVLEAGKIAEVTARIDLRQIDDAFIATIIEIARDCDAHLQTGDEEDVPAKRIGCSPRSGPRNRSGTSAIRSATSVDCPRHAPSES